MKKNIDEGFTGLRSLLWPIHRHELRRLLPMFLMSLCVCFNYSLIRTVKDTQVITAAGAEILPFLKVWAVLPAAILSTFLFAKLSNRISLNQVFYSVLGFFLLAFALFALVLYPNRDLLHPHDLVDRLEVYLWSGFRWPLAMVRYWTLTLFYVVCELWATLVIGVLFWGFANEITKVSQAGRFYGVLGLGSNIAACLAGLVGTQLTLARYHPELPFGDDQWGQTLILLTSVTLLSGAVIMGCYYWITNYTLTLDEIAVVKLKPIKRTKLSFFDSLKFLRKSPYLCRIAFIVVAYNIAINLLEVIWKGELKLLHPDKGGFSAYTYQVQFYVGVISSIAAIFMAAILRRFSWTGTALFTPVILLSTGIAFFGSLYIPEDMLGSVAIFFSMGSPLGLIVFIGGASNVLTRAAKYSVFDTTKEMAFIPLERDEKLKAKTAIDGIGSRLGKSGGSIMQQVLLLIFGSLSFITPFIAVIVVVLSVVWAMSVRTLGRQFKDLSIQQDIEESNAASISANQPNNERKTAQIVNF